MITRQVAPGHLQHQAAIGVGGFVADLDVLDDRINIHAQPFMVGLVSAATRIPHGEGLTVRFVHGRHAHHHRASRFGPARATSGQSYVRLGLAFHFDDIWNLPCCRGLGYDEITPVLVAFFPVELSDKK